ncbi:TetR/AcrR family transcriptional regulator [Rhodococcus erythropolis]|uniref:TetR/AcrR family transcriptional regulator n=1 Tax=Rhodococcus erythropolis TaxID=1833 RepID=UPI00272E4DA0|nr:TetR/AcrR family transcriptional regulator [Rhodococcus erythropolis]
MMVNMVQSRREMYAEQTRQALADCALGLFVGRGFAETSVQDITDAAGVSKGTFYNHFTDKQAAFSRLFRDEVVRIATRIDSAVQALRSMPSGHGMMVAAQVTSEFLANSVENEAHRELLRQAPAVLGDRLYRQIDHELVLPSITALLSAMQERGEVKVETQVEMAAQLLLACLCEATLAIASSGHRTSTQQEAFATVAQFFTGLLALPANGSHA